MASSSNNAKHKENVIPDTSKQFDIKSLEKSLAESKQATESFDGDRMLFRDVRSKVLPIEMADHDTDLDDVVPVNTGNDDILSVDTFGSEDPNEPISKTLCSGCGSRLHCQNSGIPGFVVASKYKSSLISDDLRNIKCQRCDLFEKHSFATNVKVEPEFYAKIISPIRKVKSLIIVVVDLTDIENSIHSQLHHFVGLRRPLVILGNKADLIPKDCPDYLDNVRNALQNSLEKRRLNKWFYLQAVHLVSSKTGFGIENFITEIWQHWADKGPVYLMGSTNSGKSTFFNALLNSDYCASSARDFIHRATTSIWPGTTLNLLKFPIEPIIDWKMKKRLARLSKSVKEEVDPTEKKQTKHPNPTLICHIGHTLLTPKESIIKSSKNSVSGQDVSMYRMDSSGRIGNVGQTEQDFWKSVENKGYQHNYNKSRQFCFDTPGVVNADQIINQLNEEELSLLLNKRNIYPRTYRLGAGKTLFVTGLGRIDYLQGDEPVYMTVFSTHLLPRVVKDTSEADKFYEENVGTDVLGLPIGGVERLQKLPSLIGREFKVQGKGWKFSSADIVLSSICWVSITTRDGCSSSFRAYTPGGKGCLLRTPAMLPYAVNLKGKRVRGDYKYSVGKDVVKMANLR